jgi:hypothetical protein
MEMGWWPSQVRPLALGVESRREEEGVAGNGEAGWADSRSPSPAWVTLSWEQLWPWKPVLPGKLPFGCPVCPRSDSP